MSCRPWAATAFTPGTPASGAITTPLGFTIRIVPEFCVIRKFPSGRNATAQAPLSPVATVSTLNRGDGFAGGAASVWPGKAGCGLRTCAMPTQQTEVRKVTQQACFATLEGDGTQRS